MFIGLILGRWLHPRGTMSRDQLSGLLFSYCGASADILEIFELLEDDVVMRKESITYTALTLYTLATLQFSLETTPVAAQDDNEAVEETSRHHRLDRYAERVAGMQRTIGHARESAKNLDILNNGKTTRVRKHDQTETRMSRYLKARKRSTKVKNSPNSTTKNHRTKNAKPNTRTKKTKMELKIEESKAARKKEMEEKRSQIRAEVFQIIVTLCMQDVPFLLMRVYLIAWYRMVGESHLFYTCKNFLVTVLLVYRLVILWNSSVDEEENISGCRELQMMEKLRTLQYVAGHLTAHTL